MKRAIQEFYENNPLMVSSPFGGVDGINEALLESVFRNLAIDVADKHILDVGCGRGFTGEYIRARGGRYTGIDLVASGSDFPLALGDATHLPFPGASFDGVLCIDAFEHFPDGAAAAREFRRVLREDGFMFLSAPNYGNVAGLVKWACETLGGYDKNTWAPFRRWQPQELEQPLTGSRVRRLYGNAGFTRIRRIGHGPEVGLGLFPWIDHPRMPEAIQFRLQRLAAWAGPGIAQTFPWTSLHGFWKMEP
ncbi:MAG: methyltransferase domain-containing protein [Candidatus Hydrogenedentes bacterium]|nr:methyltransferase domain-containing protein [Candidatus Hydrogenedentota bacterium]